MQAARVSRVMSISFALVLACSSATESISGPPAAGPDTGTVSVDPRDGGLSVDTGAPTDTTEGGVDSGARDSSSVDSSGVPDASSACGNSLRDAGEACDDGNRIGGDGCSASCQAEPLYVCNGAGPGSCVLSPAAWAQDAYVKASNTASGDWFGTAVALSADGSTLAVGALEESSSATGVGGNQDDNGALGAGAVYVFRRTGSTWVQEAYVKASNTEAHDRFGHALAIDADGSTLAVGAPGEDSSTTGVGGSQGGNSAMNSGAVYVFRRTGSTWAQEAYVKASNTDSEDAFGEVLSLSADGSALAVSAYREDSSATGVGGDQADNRALDTGAVYVFRRTGSTWTQEAYVKASNAGASDVFGYAIALSADGSTLAVGGPGEDSSVSGVGGNQADNGAIDAGAVYVFRRAAGMWTQEAYLKASNAEPSDQFGASVSLSADGSTVAVGAKWEGSSSTGVGGIQGDNSAADAGAVYVFRRTGSTWAQEAYVKASNTGAGDNFGRTLVLRADGSALAVGAPGESSSATGVAGNQADNSASLAGAVYVFRRTGSTWAQEAYLKASNTGRDDQFGAAVALSADGTTVVVGARLEDSSSTGLGGNQSDNGKRESGAVYTYVLR